MSSQEAGLMQSNVGILRAEWRGMDNRIEVVCFGTAFAVSPHIILTCAHSIYLEQQARPCSSFTFIPGIDKGKVTSTSMIYKCTPLNFLQYEPLQSGQSYIKQPIEQDIALLYLERPLCLQAYPRVGVEDQNLVDKDNQVSIAGYPSQQFLKCANIFDALFERVSLQGRILQIDGNIVYHNLNTSLGHSGSPILAYNIHQQPVILGIHTHKGSNRNSGVFLTPKLLERLIQYEINFALLYDSYKLAIKFPPRLRQSVLDQLNISDIQKILSFQSYCDQSIQNRSCNHSFTIVSERRQYGQLKNRDEINVKIGRIDNLIQASQRYLRQMKEGDMFNQVIDCCLRINELILSQLHSLLNKSQVQQLLYPPQFSSFFVTFEEGLERELQQLRQVGQQMQRKKIMSVEEHLQKLKDCDQMQSKNEVMERELYHDYAIQSEQYLRIICWPGQNVKQSMQQDCQQDQDYQEGITPQNKQVSQNQQESFFLDSMMMKLPCYRQLRASNISIYIDHQMQSIFSHLSAIIDFKLSTRKFMHRPKSNKTESSIDYVIEGQNGSSFYVLKQPNNDQCFAFVNKY